MGNFHNRADNQIRIGITIGDFNGVGPEVILKALKDQRILKMFTPILYGSSRVFYKYKKMLNLDINYHIVNANNGEIKDHRINVVNCWEEELDVQVGKVTKVAGKAALDAILRSSEDLKKGVIDAVVTAPINKNNIQSEEFSFPGHTEYYAKEFGSGKSLMLLASEDLRVGVITGHIALDDVSSSITKELIEEKVAILHNSLKQDYGISKPRIAILGLNPHAGEGGLLGEEELDVFLPAIKGIKSKHQLVFGPFPADGFFGTRSYRSYDAVLAAYHDQGLIPFKTIAFNNGVNYTAGLSVVRTSPDHGTAYNIAGKNKADETSMREAIYMACDIVKKRRGRVEKQIRPNLALQKGGKKPHHEGKKNNHEFKKKNNPPVEDKKPLVEE